MGRAKVGPNGLKTRLAVVGLGKCGAQELNYVSDVDVLFVAEPMLDDDGAPLITSEQAVSMATRMAAELTRVCSALHRGRHHLGGGLRAAAGGQGRSARPDPVQPPDLLREVGEDLGVPGHAQVPAERRRPGAGQDFVDMVAPMVWRAAERENFVADTQAMRKRVIAHIPARDAGREIKLGAGGLRDVEFSVQLLQLVHGRVDERLRDRATLDALKALIDNGYVGRDDGKGFGLAYQFMRTLEHRIQLFHLRRTHVLPDNEGDLRRLGRSLGYASRPSRCGRSGSTPARRSAGCTSGCSTPRCWTRWPGSPRRSCG